MQAAAEWAALHGGKTLNQTMKGQALTVWTKIVGNERAVALWKAASADFAKAAKGDVQFFKGANADPNGIWATVEKVILDGKGVNVVEHPVTPKPNGMDFRFPWNSQCLEFAHCPQVLR